MDDELTVSQTPKRKESLLRTGSDDPLSEYWVVDSSTIANGVLMICMEYGLFLCWEQDKID